MRHPELSAQQPCPPTGPAKRRFAKLLAYRPGLIPAHPQRQWEGTGQTSQSAFQKGMGLKGHSMGRRWGEMARVRETCSIKRKKE